MSSASPILELQGSIPTFCVALLLTQLLHNCVSQFSRCCDKKPERNSFKGGRCILILSFRCQPGASSLLCQEPVLRQRMQCSAEWSRVVHQVLVVGSRQMKRKGPGTRYSSQRHAFSCLYPPTMPRPLGLFSYKFITRLIHL